MLADKQSVGKYFYEHIRKPMNEEGTGPKFPHTKL